MSNVDKSSLEYQARTGYRRSKIALVLGLLSTTVLGGLLIAVYAFQNQSTPSVDSHAASRQKTLQNQPDKAKDDIASVIRVVDPIAGHIRTVPIDINNFNAVTGYSMPQTNIPRAFLWDNGRSEDLGTLGGPDSRGKGINDKRLVVGDSRQQGAPLNEAFVYESSMRLLQGSNGYSDAKSINHEGVIAGFIRYGVNKLKAVYWDKGGNVNEMGTLGGDMSMANAINSVGNMTGVSSLQNNGINQRAFFWDMRRRVMEDLRVGGESWGNAINDQDVVVGEVQTNEGKRGFRVSRNSINNRVEILPPLSGDSQSRALAINNDGIAVGTSDNCVYNEPGCSKAVVWHGSNSVDLNNYLVEVAGVTGWTVETASAINDNNYIVGTGTRDGQAVGYLLYYRY